MDISAFWLVLIVIVAMVLTAAASNPKWPGIGKVVGETQTFVFVVAALWIVVIAVRTLFRAF